MGSNKINKISEQEYYKPPRMSCPRYSSLIDAIKALYLQREIPVGQIPSELIDQIVKFFNEDYKTLGLHFIGGESFLIHCQNELCKDIALKIAFPSIWGSEGNRQVIHWSESLRDGYEIKRSDIAEERFVSGVQIQKTLHNICKAECKKDFYIPAIYSICKDPLIVEMEWALGNTFDTFIASRPTFMDKLVAFKKILKATQFIHENGFIHRDLKPENILFSDDVVTIIDWTIAKQISSQRNLTVKGTGIGTPAYASPLQLTNAAEATFTDDIFLLGFTFAAIIMGTKMPTPVSSKSDTLLQRKAKFRKLIIDKKLDFPVFFHNVFLKATALYVDERYQDVEEFLTDVDNLIYQLETTQEGKELCYLPATQYPKMTFDPRDERNIPTIITPKVETTPVSPIEKIENVKELVDELTEIMIMRCRLKNKTCLGNCTSCTNKILNRTMITLVVETIDELKKRNKI